MHNIIVHVTHLPIPLQETGAFNLFAWQAVWITGLWLGAKSAEDDIPLKRIPGYVVAVCAMVCLFFIGIRHEWLGPHLTQQALGMKLDKWQIGPLRVINLVTFTIVFYWLRKYILRIVAVEPPIAHQGLGENIFRFLQRQTLGSTQESLPPVGIDIDLHTRLVLYIIDDSIQQSAEIVEVRQPQLQDSYIFR